MTNRNKKIIWSVSIVLALLLSYAVGSIMGKNAALRSFVKQYKASDIEVSYGRYIGYRDISSSIEHQKYDSAKCVADLNASGLYDKLTACLSDNECSKLIAKDTEYKIAPELFDKNPIGFRYYTIKDGTRSCEGAN